MLSSSFISSAGRSRGRPVSRWCSIAGPLICRVLPIFIFCSIVAPFQASSASSNSGSRKSGKKARGSVEIRKYIEDLRDNAPPQALAAAVALKSRQNDLVSKALLAALESGVSPEIAIEILSGTAIRRPEWERCLQIVLHYAGHRSAKVRSLSLDVLRDFRQPRARDALLAALGDRASSVRLVAAQGVGAAGDQRAGPLLLSLVSRGDAAMAEYLAQVAGAETSEALAKQAERSPTAALIGALAALLKRKTFGPDPLRVRLVRVLGRIRGARSTAAIFEYLSSVPSEDKRPSKQIAEEILAGRH